MYSSFADNFEVLLNDGYSLYYSRSNAALRINSLKERAYQLIESMDTNDYKSVIKEYIIFKGMSILCDDSNYITASDGNSKICYLFNKQFVYQFIDKFTIQLVTYEFIKSIILDRLFDSFTKKYNSLLDPDEYRFVKNYWGIN